MSESKVAHRTETGCIDGFLPVSPIIRRPSVWPCPYCEQAERDTVSVDPDAKAAQEEIDAAGPLGSWDDSQGQS